MPAAEQRALAGRLYERTVQDEIGFDLTPEQRADLTDAVAQAERGDVLTAAVLRDAIATRFGFSAK